MSFLFDDAVLEQIRAYAREIRREDALTEVFRLLAQTASIATLPYYLQPLANQLILYAGDVGNSLYKTSLFAALRDTDIAKLEERKKLGQTRPIQGPLEQPSKEKFEGFKEGNVVLFGVTQSGKTTNFITWLYNGLISNFDLFILVGSDLLKEESIQQIRTGIQYALMEQGKEFNNDICAYYNRSQIEDAIDFATSKNGDKKKLVFFDDIQLDGNGRRFDKVALFTQEAKHANVTVYTSLHMSFNDKAAEIIRSSAKYFVLFNQHEQNFNRLLKLEKGNKLWRKYNLIADIHERVVIHDIVTANNYFGTWPYSRMDPLIHNENENIAQPQPQQQQQQSLTKRI